MSKIARTADRSASLRLASAIALKASGAPALVPRHAAEFTRSSVILLRSNTSLRAACAYLRASRRSRPSTSCRRTAASCDHRRADATSAEHDQFLDAIRMHDRVFRDAPRPCELPSLNRSRHKHRRCAKYRRALQTIRTGPRIGLAEPPTESSPIPGTNRTGATSAPPSRQPRTTAPPPCIAMRTGRRRRLGVCVLTPPKTKA